MQLSTIQQAAKRLEELQRAGVNVPWAAAGLPDARFPSAVSRLTGIASDDHELSASGAIGQQESPPPLVAVSAPANRNPNRVSKAVELDLARLLTEGYLVPSQPRNALADQFRVIKRPLLKNARGTGASLVHRGNLIQVTSAQPGEGKSFVAINLAMSIASEVDHSVLLVDADVLRPSVLHRLGLSAEKGLLDLLRTPGMELSDVLLRTNVPKLSLLPAGTASANSTELLASSAIEALLDQLASRFADRIVIFDSPPLLSTPESRVLTTRVGQIVMVVESFRSSRKDVAEAFATVSGCPVVLSVLNKCRDRGAVGAYGY